MSAVRLVLPALLLVSACNHHHAPAASPDVDGPVRLLDSGNPGGDDDDPAVAVDAQGNLHVVFFSDRDGSKDLYAVHSTGFDLTGGTITWSTPVQVTDNDKNVFPPPTFGDNFPSLFIDDTGTHHLAWHRWYPITNETHILYAQSDGTAGGWAATTVVPVTTGPNFDRFPQVVKFAKDDLRIYFGSKTRKTADKNDIFMSQSADGGASWSVLPSEVASLNSATEQSHFPHVVKLANNSFIATFARWKLEPSNDALDASSDIFYATSSDAVTWNVEQVTSNAGDNQNDFTPTLFFDHAGAARLAWTTIASGDPAGDNVQMRVSDRASYPNGVAALSPDLGVPDHSPQVATLTVAGRQVYVMIWVKIANPPHNQIVYRMVSNL